MSRQWLRKQLQSQENSISSCPQYSADDAEQSRFDVCICQIHLINQVPVQLDGIAAGEAEAMTIETMPLLGGLIGILVGCSDASIRIGLLTAMPFPRWAHLAPGQIEGSNPEECDSRKQGNDRALSTPSHGCTRSTEELAVSSYHIFVCIF